MDSHLTFMCNFTFLKLLAANYEVAFIAHRNQLLQQMENIPWHGEYSYFAV